MLTSLAIRDVVLIERLDLTFPAGLCVLTGETGAGKSILLDALGLALGVRAEARLVRAGAPQAVVTAAFEVTAEAPAAAVLAEHGLGDWRDGVILRRTLAADGRSKAFVNDQPVSVGLLKSLGESLVEVHGQFESQRLLRPSSHRDLLDAFAGAGPLVARVRSDHAAWRAATDALGRAEDALREARRDESYLRHAAQEIAALAPQSGEETALAERRGLMQHGEKLLEALSQAAVLIAGDDGVDTRMRSALRNLEHVAQAAHGALDPLIAAMERAASEATEAVALLERASADIDLDPQTLEKIEERLFTLRALARKHAVEVDGLAGLGENLARQLEALDNSGANLERLAAEEQAARATFVEGAYQLSRERQNAAAKLGEAMASELESLRLGKARFAVRVEGLDENDWNEHGCDRVVFEVATNPGSPPGPLNKIASGGELARFMLGLKAVLAGADPVPTLIFDEVDAGIGGAVAAAVGERLVGLAQDVQVLVVTHSPQVAARGTHHWRVTKGDAGPATDAPVLTSVDALDAGDRTEEIARMLAGASVTDEARAAAASLLQGADA